MTHLGFIEETELLAFFSKEYGVPTISLDEFDIGPEVIALIAREFAWAHRIVPVNRAGASIIVAMADPSDIETIDAVRRATGLNVEVTVSSERGVERALQRYYASGQENG